MAEMKKRRHRLTNMQYDEISLVDRGANQHADVVIVKAVAPILGNGDKVLPMPKRKAQRYSADKATNPGIKGAPSKKKKSSSGSGGSSERAQNWDEAKHPRESPGDPTGGEFAETSAESKKKNGKGGTTKAKQDAKKKAAAKDTKGAKSVTTKKGDTLWAMAEKYYGDVTKWKLIARANGVKDPKKLQIGVKLKIPALPGKSTKTSAKKTAGTKLVMEPGGKVHYEKIKAGSPVKKFDTGSERLAVKIMFQNYTHGRR